MLPLSLLNHAVDRAAIDSKLFRKFGHQTEFSMGLPVKRKNGSHFAWIQFRGKHLSASWSSAAAFAIHVLEVVALCSKKEVVRPYANAVIAAMANALTIWNLTKVNQPREPMCGNGWGSMLHAKLSVASGFGWSFPLPAVFSFADLIPEPLDQTRGEYHTV